ncbi:MAG: SPOR domain-containing protein [Pseudomonadota bacterium]
MKLVLYLLLLANLGFFAWSNFFAEKPVRMARVARAGPSLTLASEANLPIPALLSQSDGSGETEVPVDPPGPDPDTEPLARSTCWSLGPFTDAKEAESAIVALNDKDVVPIQRESQQDVWVGYWVHLPAFKEYSQAEALGLSLRDKGIRDIYVEPHGELANTVSLGVFKERERAYSRIEELSGLGVNAKLGNRYRLGTVYWLDFGAAETAPVSPRDFPTKPGRILRLQSYTCTG